MFSCSTDIELVTFTEESGEQDQDEKLLLTETILSDYDYDIAEEAARSFIFLEEDPSCEKRRLSENVPIPSINLNISGWKPLESPRPERKWSTRSVPDEVKTAEGRMEKNYSRFTSYVDLEGSAGLELEMKPDLLKGEMMITQADKVCLYSSQSGG